jgi:ribosomal 30S subunit maturation factor RimM
MAQAQTRHLGFERPFGGLEESVGYEVLDPVGHKIGRVEKIFSNGNGGPEYVRVRIGLLSRKIVLIPVRDVALDRAAQSLTLK